MDSPPAPAPTPASRSSPPGRGETLTTDAFTIAPASADASFRPLFPRACAADPMPYTPHRSPGRHGRAAADGDLRAVRPHRRRGSPRAGVHAAAGSSPRICHAASCCSPTSANATYLAALDPSERRRRSTADAIEALVRWQCARARVSCRPTTRRCCSASSRCFPTGTSAPLGRRSRPRRRRCSTRRSGSAWTTTSAQPGCSSTATTTRAT